MLLYDGVHSSLCMSGNPSDDDRAQSAGTVSFVPLRMMLTVQYYCTTSPSQFPTVHPYELRALPRWRCPTVAFFSLDWCHECDNGHVHLHGRREAPHA